MPPLVLLHGFTHTGASWDPVRAALGRGYPAATPDLRGHGAAGAVRPVSLAGVLADLEAVVVPGCVLSGYSMGGRIALHAALAPALADRAARLVLIGASPGLASAEERAARRAADEALAERAEGMTIDAFAAAWAAETPVLGGQPPAVRRWVREDRLRNEVTGLAAALRGLGTGALPSLWERLGDVAVPATLVVGERDEKFRAIAAKMAERLPRADLKVVARAGHAVHLEAPDVVARILTRRTS